MEFHEAVARRRMVRSYRTDPVDPDALDRIVDAARRGPSAGFAQGVELIVATAESTRAALAAAANEAQFLERGFEPWLSAAPVHIVVAVDPDAYRRRYGQSDKGRSTPPDEWKTPYWLVDAGAALMLLLLAATDEGLAAGFLGNHAFDDLGGVVGIPESFETIGLVTIGHPAEAPPVGSARRPRRSRTDTTHTERWAPGRRNEPNR